MAAARFWRIAQVEPYAGGDLEFSEVALYEAETRLDTLATVSCTVPPLSGTLADLSDGSFAAAVRWDGTTPLPPGFALVWDFGPGTPRDIAKVGLAGPSQATFAHKFLLESSPDGLSWTTQLQPYPATAFCGGGAFYELSLTKDPGDPFFNAVVLLLHMDGTPGTAAFTDVTGKTVTAVGSAKLSGTTVKFGSASGAVVDGPGYLSLAGTDAFALTGDFTIEGWIYATAALGCPLVNNQSTTNKFLALFMDSLVSGRVLIDGVDTVTGIVLPGGSTWFHYALVRSGTTLRAYVNGAPSGTTATLAGTVGNTHAITLLGSAIHPGFRGYLDDLRVTKGIARYGGAFTPPSTAFPESLGVGVDPYAASVVLLLRMDGTHGSTTFLEETGKSVTVNGSTQLSTAQSKFGGASAYFDGAGDFLQVADHADFDLPGDFTLEFWLRCETFGSSANGNRCPLSFGVAGLGGASPCLLLGTEGRLLFYTSTTILTSTAALTLNTWQHVAAVRSGGTLTLYIDGAGAGSVSYTTAIAPGGVLIGRSMPTTGDFQGFLDDLRITRGVARYTGSFTPQALLGLSGGDPDATSVALLLSFDTSTADASPAQAVPSLYGAPLIVSTGQKYGGGALSVGTPDYLRYDTVGPLGTGDYTIECWVYSRRAPATNSGLLAVGSCIANISSVQGLFLYQNANLNLKIYQNGVKLTATVGLPLAVWTHLAVVRRAGVVTLYVDGVPSGTPFADTNSYLAGVSLGGPSLGGIDALDGLIDDVRVTKGVARYTGAFTPPGPVVGQKAFDATPLRLPVRGHRFDLAGEGVGDAALYAPRALDADLDREDGGRGILRGTVKEKALPQDTPLRRRVVLLNDLDHRVVRETWSDAVTGEYTFPEIDPNRRYTVLAYDHTGTYRAVVADNLAAEPLP